MDSKDSVKDYLLELPNYLSIFIVPIYFMTVGPMLIEMSNDTGFSSGDLSLVFTFFTIGLILGQLTSIFYNRRFRKLHIIIVSYIIVVICLILLGISKKLYLFYSLYFLNGYVAGIIWLQATTYILESKIKNKDRLTTIFLSFYPLGNITAPFIASALIENGLSWRYSYYITAVVAVIILIFYLVMMVRKDKKIILEDREKINFKEIFVNKSINIIFIMGCVLLFLYCLSETIIATWSPTFLRTIRMLEIQTASLAVSVFWIAIFTGRMIVSFIAGKVKSNYIMLILSAIGIVSMALFVFAKTIFFIFIAIGFAGLGCSGIITLGISSASTVYEKGRGLLASIVFASVNAGVSLAPFITRLISSLNMIFSIALASIFMLFTGIIILNKTLYENKIRMDNR
jgi:MFS family permease